MKRKTDLFVACALYQNVRPVGVSSLKLHGERLANFRGLGAFAFLAPACECRSVLRILFC